MNTIYPWQTKQWHDLWQVTQAQRLSQALWLVGPPGIGKTQFATAWIYALLCERASVLEPSCQHCHACHMVAARSHPDVLWVEPEKEGQAIKVDQIRAVSAFANQTAWQNGKRVVAIDPAASMNDYAANALLKTLEEPPLGILFLLIGGRHLPATIISRCQRIVFTRPARQQAITWLQAQQLDPAIDKGELLDATYGAPLAALRLAQDNHWTQRQALFQALYLLSQQQSDPLADAVQWQAMPLALFIEWIQSWVIDVLRLQLNGDIMHEPYRQPLMEWQRCTHIKQVVCLLDELQQLQREIAQGIHLNKQLLLERVLIRWQECFSPRHSLQG